MVHALRGSSYGSAQVALFNRLGLRLLCSYIKMLRPPQSRQNSQKLPLFWHSDPCPVLYSRLHFPNLPRIKLIYFIIYFYNKSSKSKSKFKMQKFTNLLWNQTPTVEKEYIVSVRLYNYNVMLYNVLVLYICTILCVKLLKCGKSY